MYLLHRKKYFYFSAEAREELYAWILIEWKLGTSSDLALSTNKSYTTHSNFITVYLVKAAYLFFVLSSSEMENKENHHGRL